MGAACFFFLLWFLSGSVWNITVSGNQGLTREEIVEMLAKQGVTEGTRVSKIDEQNTAQAIILDNPQISWMSINPMGSTLYVDVKERRYAPDIADKTPQNIVAAKDGVVVSVKAEGGEAFVKSGDAVTKGQVLISGIISLKNGATVFRAADGEIEAQVCERVTVFVPYERTESFRTGEQRTERVLKFFGTDIPISFAGAFASFEKQQSYTPLVIGGKQLPIGIFKTMFYQTDVHTLTVTEQQAKQQAEQKALEELALRLKNGTDGQSAEEAQDGGSAQAPGAAEADTEFLNGRIVSSSQSFCTTEEGVQLTVDYICLENISKKQKIDHINDALSLD